VEEVMRKEMLVQYLKQIERKEHLESIRGRVERPRFSEEEIEDGSSIIFARP